MKTATMASETARRKSVRVEHANAEFTCESKAGMVYATFGDPGASMLRGILISLVLSPQDARRIGVALVENAADALSGTEARP